MDSLPWGGMICSTNTEADPGASKGKLSCRWLGGGWRAHSLISCYIFEAGTSTKQSPLSSVSLFIIAILAFADGCEVSKAV